MGCSLRLLRFLDQGHRFGSPVLAPGGSGLLDGVLSLFCWRLHLGSTISAHCFADDCILGSTISASDPRDRALAWLSHYGASGSSFRRAVWLPAWRNASLHYCPHSIMYKFRGYG